LENDIELVKKAKNNVECFESLYSKYFPMINNFVFHRVDGEDTRHEIVSEVFFKAIKKMYMFQFFESRNSSFSAWLYKITVNEINAYYRNTKRNRIISERGMEKAEIDSLEDNISRPDYQLVKEELSHYSSDDQNLITLRYFEKIPYNELTNILGQKESALKVRVHRIINKMRQNLESKLSENTKTNFTEEVYHQ